MSLQCFHSAATTNNSKLHYYSFYKKQKRFFYLKKCNFVFLTKTFGTKTPVILPQLSLLAHLGMLTQSSHAHDQQSTETNHDIEVFKKAINSHFLVCSAKLFRTTNFHASLVGLLF